MKKIMSNTSVFLMLLSFLAMNLSVLVYYQLSRELSGLMMITYSFVTVYFLKKEYKTVINSNLLFSFIFFFTIGLSMIGLHQYQSDWKILTFVILELSYFAYSIGYALNTRRTKDKEVLEEKLSIKKAKIASDFIFYGSLIGFLLEVAVRKYIPLFSGNMASYQEFGITGVHYFTVSCALYVPFAYIMFKDYTLTKHEKVNIIVKLVISVLIPILIVSRQLLILELCMVLFLIIQNNPKKELKFLLIGVLLLFFAWGFVSIFRNQNTAYLKETLKIQENAPLSVNNMQLYMYVSFNYDNFNANVGNITQHTYGYQSLFPAFALTGTKFLLQKHMNVNYVRVINAYTTYPIQMTPYEDFGVIGVIVYMFVLGIICRQIEIKKNKNALNKLNNCIALYCMLFSFFASFFSNATVGFYFLFIFLISTFLKYYKKGDA